MRGETYRAILVKAPKPIQKPVLLLPIKHRICTIFFSQNSLEFLPSSLWHKSKTQLKLFTKTCSDEILFWVDFPPLNWGGGWETYHRARPPKPALRPHGVGLVCSVPVSCKENYSGWTNGGETHYRWGGPKPLFGEGASRHVPALCKIRRKPGFVPGQARGRPKVNQTKSLCLCAFFLPEKI